MCRGVWCVHVPWERRLACAADMCVRVCVVALATFVHGGVRVRMSVCLSVLPACIHVCLKVLHVYTTYTGRSHNKRRGGGREGEGGGEADTWKASSCRTALFTLILCCAQNKT